jgi:hypothetical protein
MKVLWSNVGGHVIAVAAERVEAATDLASAGRDDTVDVAALLGVAVSGGEMRRVLRVRSGGAALLLLVGESVGVADVPAPQPLPELVAGLGITLGVAGVAPLAGAFGYVLDVDRLAQATRRVT